MRLVPTKVYDVEIELDSETIRLDMDIPNGLSDNQIYRYILESIQVDWTER